MSDVQEAADRILNVFKSRLHYGHLCGSLDADIVKVAELVLAEHDATPIDEGWLREVGGELEYSNSSCRKYVVGGYIHVYFWSRVDLDTTIALGDGYEPPVTTRGDLRRLCTALGVPLGVTTQTTNGDHT